MRGGRSELKEGKLRSRAVVLEFPSYEAALACYRSPEYQAAFPTNASFIDSLYSNILTRPQRISTILVATRSRRATSWLCSTA